MKSYEFLCGGDRGAWETEVTVDLTEEDEAVLTKFGADDRNEHLYWTEETDKVYSKVIDALVDQCDENLDVDSVVIWVPSEFRKDI